MNRKTQAVFDERARILKALAHPSRLYIVDLLASGDRCVCELTSKVGADTSTVSKHLSILKSAGIVSSRRRGLQVHYHLKTPCVLRFLTCVEEVIARSAREHAGLVSIR